MIAAKAARALDSADDDGCVASVAENPTNNN
jgi:hypothetical protein